DRKKTIGMRLNIASGTAIRFEPGQTRDVELIEIKGKRNIFGFNQKIMGAL
ncbi:urease subunit beta, partial [Alphaproteobacteria bacterium]|nr:urease subunit beta [Alphaproteobacteria bacterium]